MIAASEPQEFVPSGRWHALRYIKKLQESSCEEIGLLDHFKRVSLTDNSTLTEWWSIRKVPVMESSSIGTNTYNNNSNNDHNHAENDIPNSSISMSTQSNDILYQSISFKSANTSFRSNKRISDNSFTKVPSKRRFSEDYTKKISSNVKSSKQGDGLTKWSCSKQFSTEPDINYMEEELYVSGNTVIWSRGLLDNYDDIDNGRYVLCAYTCPLPIKQALWCTFYCERPTFDSIVQELDNNIEEPSGTPMNTICIADSSNLRVFCVDGEDFVIGLSFEIKCVWNTKFGILIERNSTMAHETALHSDNRGSLFSLAYPLNEICPVVINQGSNMHVVNNTNIQIVYTSVDPSLCMTYDTNSKQHSIYLIRKLTSAEKMDNTRNTLNQTSRLRQNLSLWESAKCTNDATTSTNSHTAPRPTSSATGSLLNIFQPKSLNSIGMMSRCQSPITSSTGTNPWILRQARLSGSMPMATSSTTTGTAMSRSYFDCSKAACHVNPNICLDYLWSDNIILEKNDINAPATKVFIYCDFADQQYLCYMLSTRLQLMIVRIDTSDTEITGFTMLTSIAARDAVLIPQLHLVAILETSGNVIFYSGLIAVGKLHVGGTAIIHTPAPYVRRSMSCSPFPRRSSLLPSCKLSDLHFEEHLLSPVLPSSTMGVKKTNDTLPLNPIHSGFGVSSKNAVLSGFLDSIENRLILHYSDNSCYRVTLPPFACSSLVQECLMTLRQCLDADLANIVLAKWYSTRNTLGTEQFGADQEWNMFTVVLYDLLGYENINDEEISNADTSFQNPKKQKQSEYGTDDDWKYIQNSNHQQFIFESFGKIVPIFEEDPNLTRAKCVDKNFHKFNINALLFSQMKVVFFNLHLLYEDIKLNVLRSECLSHLAQLLNKLSNDLGLINYSVHYWKDFPSTCNFQAISKISPQDLEHIDAGPEICQKPASIVQFLYDMLMGKQNDSYPFMNLVNNRSKDVIQISAVTLRENIKADIKLGHLVKSIRIEDQVIVENDLRTINTLNLQTGSVCETATLLMVNKKFTGQDLDTLPIGIYLLFYGVLWKCRENPPLTWPSEAYYLLQREDLAAQVKKIKKGDSCEKCISTNPKDLAFAMNQYDAEGKDGMEELDNPLMKLRFSNDVRVLEARKMLQSAKPVPITLVQRSDVSDHDFIEQQEKHLYAICTRTMALPPGRGIVTLRTSTPVITEPLSTPVLCLTGKAPPKGTTIELNHIDTPSNMSLWPLFHNGVANGLRISTEAHNISNSWIIFNKPKGSVEQQMEHAGFLMALGLNGHLKNLDVLSTYDYLIKIQEMTSIGILLGLAASFRGTADYSLTKPLSIHVEALLPPTSMEVDVPQNLQVASLLGVGLLYQSTAHRHIIEVLLSEIGRPPGPEMENSIDRESYSLAAGLALGLVTLRQGGSSSGLSDLNIADTLHYYMVGGNRRPLTGAQKDKYRVPSFQIREGSTVNLDVTSPGATIALGLMYFGTGNKAIADWMAPPQTQYLLDFIRPDFLLFRILARGLILWNEIEPTKEWVESQVPDTIKQYCMIRPLSNLNIDYEAINQSYCNLITGACFVLGLKFAGSGDDDAFETLLHFCHVFTRLSVKSISELAGKPTVETCLNVLLISAAMVMAGTGNLELMRLVRHLRKRVGVNSSVVVSYGSHLATHMALGLLFIGGGRCTFSNTAESVAALICAFYPKFPTHSNDNRYHLQCFRHLYVLAVEPRIIIPRDISTGSCCYTNLRIVKIDGSIIKKRAPTIIPDPSSLLRITVDDERYWPVVFERGCNWELLTHILKTNGCIEVKQRAGCLSYEVDKFGYQSQLARTLAQSGILPWNPTASSILSFTYDKSVHYFCGYFLSTVNTYLCNEDELKFKQSLTKMAYEAVIRDKLIVIPVYTSLVKLIHTLKNGSPSTMELWQMKLIVAQILHSKISSNLLPAEVILAIEQKLDEIIDSWNDVLRNDLQKYVNGTDLNPSNDLILKLALSIIHHEIPYNEMEDCQDCCEFLSTCDYNCKTFDEITKIFNFHL